MKLRSICQLSVMMFPELEMVFAFWLCFDFVVFGACVGGLQNVK